VYQTGPIGRRGRERERKKECFEWLPQKNSLGFE